MSGFGGGFGAGGKIGFGALPAAGAKPAVGFGGPQAPSVAGAAPKVGFGNFAAKPADGAAPKPTGFANFGGNKPIAFGAAKPAEAKPAEVKAADAPKAEAPKIAFGSFGKAADAKPAESKPADAPVVPKLSNIGAFGKAPTPAKAEEPKQETKTEAPKETPKPEVKPSVAPTPVAQPQQVIVQAPVLSNEDKKLMMEKFQMRQETQIFAEQKKFLADLKDVLVEAQTDLFKKVFEEKIASQRSEIERVIREKVEQETKAAIGDQISALKAQIQQLKQKQEVQPIQIQRPEIQIVQKEVKAEEPKTQNLASTLKLIKMDNQSIVIAMMVIVLLVILIKK